MPGLLLNEGSVILCSHGGQAHPAVLNPRVLVNGLPTVTVKFPFTIAGCAFRIGTIPSACLTANWVSAAARITSNGSPLLLTDSRAICMPNGTPVIIGSNQTRVKGM